MSRVAAIRGAITAEANTKDEILMRTEELLSEIAAENRLAPEDIISIIFTATRDLDAAFPAEAARKMGWLETPLLDAVEISVPGSLPRTIRVLVHINTREDRFKPQHVYLRDAAQLRPDLEW